MRIFYHEVSIFANVIYFDNFYLGIKKTLINTDATGNP